MYAGQIRSMPPRLLSDDGDNIVIRPLCYSAEADIAEYARLKAFPILPCDLCGSQDGLKRKQVKQLIATLEHDNPKLRGNLFAALGNVRASTLLGSDRSETSETSETAHAGRRLRVLPSV
jgi:tRNA 2-thiocytidine biosynthesis protein TtcA